MAINIRVTESVATIAELAEFLLTKDFSITDRTAICPHCFQEANPRRRKDGPHSCTRCKRVYYLYRRGRGFYTTSKKEIPRDKL